MSHLEGEAQQLLALGQGGQRNVDALLQAPPQRLVDVPGEVGRRQHHHLRSQHNASQGRDECSAADLGVDLDNYQSCGVTADMSERGLLVMRPLPIFTISFWSVHMLPVTMCSVVSGN